MPNRVVVVHTFANEIEAHLTRQRLLEEEIPSLLMRDDAGGFHPALSFVHGVRLAVRRSDLARTLEVLRELEGDGSLDPSEESGPQDVDFDDDPSSWP